MCNTLAKIFPLEPAMHCSSHFISLFKKKERKREREALLLLLAENPLEEKTSIVALLQASLHQEKDSSCWGLYSQPLEGKFLKFSRVPWSLIGGLN